MTGIIDSFTGEYEFLSNFYVGKPITFNPHVEGMSAEHLFQAMKCRTGTDVRKILACATPGEAKAEGRHLLTLRPDWDRVKLDVMRVVLSAKFTLEREEGLRLVATEAALLRETNTWNDTTWGAAVPKGQPPASAVGRNWLGVLLMARRAELLAEGIDGPVADYSVSRSFIRYLPATPDR